MKMKTGPTQNHSHGSDGGKVTMRSLLSIAIIRALCLSGMALAFLNTGFDVVFVLFCYSPVRLGGLALDVRDFLPPYPPSGH
jgi:hypothetical protein